MNVYCLHSRARRTVKIGVARNVEQRIRQLTCEHGALALLKVWTCDSTPEAFRLEKALHWWHRRDHVRLEWFTERVLDDLETDPRNAYARTRIYEVRLDRDDVAALKARGLTIEDAVRLLQV
jgi:predicted GIY-YIG superfamily endonuclease